MQAARATHLWAYQLGAPLVVNWHVVTLALFRPQRPPVFCPMFEEMELWKLLKSLLFWSHFHWQAGVQMYWLPLSQLGVCPYGVHCGPACVAARSPHMPNWRTAMPVSATASHCQPPGLICVSLLPPSFLRPM